MATTQYNLNLLNAISSAKKGESASISFTYSVTKNSDSILVENALNQWVKFFETFYSEKHSCRGSLSFSFVNAKKADLKLGSIKNENEKSLSKVIYTIGQFLKIPMYKNFNNLNYTRHFNLKLSSAGILDSNGLIKDSTIKSQVSSIYGHPKNLTPVVYGITNSKATNYNVAANKNNGIGTFEPFSSRTFYPSSLYRTGSSNLVAISSAGVSLIDSLEDSNSYLIDTSAALNFAEGISAATQNDDSYFFESLVFENSGSILDSNTVFDTTDFRYVLATNQYAEFLLNDRNNNYLATKWTGQYGAEDLWPAVATSKSVFESGSNDHPASAILLPTENYRSRPHIFAVSLINKARTHRRDTALVVSTQNAWSVLIDLDPQKANSILIGSSVVSGLDCDNPDLPLGNLSRAGGENENFVGGPLMAAGANQFEFADFFFSTYDAYGRVNLEPVGGINSWMTPTGDLVGLSDNFNASSNFYGGNSSEYYFPPLGDGFTQTSMPSINDGLYANDTHGCGYYIAPDGAYRQYNNWNTGFQGIGAPTLNVTKIKSSKRLVILAPTGANNLRAKSDPLFQEQKASIINSSSSRSESNNGWHNFNYIDNTDYKDYLPRFMVFDTLSSQHMTILPFSLDANGEFKDSDSDGPISHLGAFDAASLDWDLIKSTTTSHVYGVVNSVVYYWRIESGDSANIADGFIHSYMKGFSFDVGEDYHWGVYKIAGNKFVDSGNYGFTEYSDTWTVDPVASPQYVVPTGYTEAPFSATSTALLMQDAAIAMSTRKKSIVGTYMGDHTTNPFVIMANQPENTKGCYVVAYGVLHGFILMYMNEYGQFLPPSVDSGVELHIPGGQWSKTEVKNEGGYLPISMAFSPGDNYLYTIVKSKDTDEKYICIYDVSSIGLGQTGATAQTIVDSAIMIANPFSGDLTRVDRSKDGKIYFFSHNSFEYISISSPDSSESVNMFINLPHTFVKLSYNSFDYLPIMSTSISTDHWLEDGRHTVPSEEEQISTSELVLVQAPQAVNDLIDTSSGNIIHLNTLTVSDAELPDEAINSNHLFPQIDINPFKVNTGCITCSQEFNGLFLPNFNTNLHGFYHLVDYADTPKYAIIPAQGVDQDMKNTYEIYKINSPYDPTNLYTSLNPSPGNGHFHTDNYHRNSDTNSYIKSLFREEYDIDVAFDFQINTMACPIFAGSEPFTIVPLLNISNTNFINYENITNQTLQELINFPSSGADLQTGIIYYIFSNERNVGPFSTYESANGEIQTGRNNFLITGLINDIVLPQRSINVSNLYSGDSTNEMIIAQGFGKIKVNEQSFWLVNLILQDDSPDGSSPEAKLTFNLVDQDFNTSSIWESGSNAAEDRDFFLHNISFSNSVEYSILNHLETCPIPPSAFNVETASPMLQSQFGLYGMGGAEDGLSPAGSTSGLRVFTNTDSTRICVSITDSNLGTNWLLFYMFDTATAGITLIRATSVSSLEHIAMQSGLSGDPSTPSENNNYTNWLSKFTFNHDSSIAYLLTTKTYTLNTEARYRRRVQSLLKINLTNLESLDSSQVEIPQNGSIVDFVDPYPNISSEYWPAEFDIDQFDPLVRLLNNGGYSDSEQISTSTQEDTVVIDNLFMSRDGDIYLSARKTPGIFNDGAEKASIGKIVNSTFWDESRYTLFSHEIPNANGTEHGGLYHGDQLIIKGPSISYGGDHIVTQNPIDVNVTSGCGREFSVNNIVHCNFDPEVNMHVEGSCLEAPNNLEAVWFSSPNYVECSCDEEIVVECGECYTAGEAPDAASVCGVCNIEGADNYTPLEVGVNIANNNLCEWGICADINSCNDNTSLVGTTPPWGFGVYVADNSVCYYSFSNCDCTNTPNEGYCGSCGIDIYLQPGLTEGYCACENTLQLIPSEELSEVQFASYAAHLNGDSNNFDGKYCNCEGSMPSTSYCGCDNETVFAYYTLPELGMNMICDCEGTTAHDLHGPYCDCDGEIRPEWQEGNANGFPACDCNQLQVTQYPDADGDDLGVGEGAQVLCPVVNEDGTLSAQPGFSFNCCDTDDTCANGEYDDCGLCVEGGSENPDFCSDGVGWDECGECCGGNQSCLDCHDVPNGLGPTPDNPCPGFQWCECTATYEPDTAPCSVIDEGCGCGNGPVNPDCNDCTGPDADGCCGDTTFDSCLNECSYETLTTEDLCGNCYHYPDQDPDFNSCVGCTDPEAINYVGTFQLHSGETVAITVDDGSCEYEEYVEPYVSPNFEGVVNSSGEAVSSANMEKAIIAFPSQYPEKLPLSLMAKTTFDVDTTNFVLNQYPACLTSDQGCEVYRPNTVNAQNPISSDKVQILSARNYRVLLVNPSVNSEVTYSLDSSGHIVNIPLNNVNRSYNHFNFSNKSLDSQNQDSIFIPNIELTDIENTPNQDIVNAIPSGSTLVYTPKYYFRFDDSLKGALVTDKFSDLFKQKEQFIDTIRYYEILDIPEHTQLSGAACKNIVEKIFNPIPITIYENNNWLVDKIHIGRKYQSSNDITDTVGNMGAVHGTIIYEVIPTNQHTHSFAETIIDIQPFVVTEEPDPETEFASICCLPCSPSYGIGTTNLGEPFSMWDAMVGMTNEEILNQIACECNETTDCPGGVYADIFPGSVMQLCEDCPPPDPCPDGPSYVCTDPLAESFIPEADLTECQVSQNSLCTYQCFDNGAVLSVCCDQAYEEYFDISLVAEGQEVCYACDNSLCKNLIYIEPEPDPILGCMDPNACNYNAAANQSDPGTCDYTCYGCMDILACNYNPSAVSDTYITSAGITITFECQYAAEGEDCEGNPLEPIEPDPEPDPDPVIEPGLGEWIIETSIFTNSGGGTNLTNQDIRKLEWVIYSNQQHVVQVSPMLSEYESTSFGYKKIVSIHDAVTKNKCLWFLPLGVEQADVWAYANLVIKDPLGNIYHNIDHGFTSTNTGSILLTALSNPNSCKFGCNNSAPLLVTENCVKYVKEDSDEFTTFTLTVSPDSEFTGTGDTIKVVSVDSNEVLAEVSNIYAGGIFTDTFILNRDTKIAVKHIIEISGKTSDLQETRNIKYKITSEFGELLIDKKF